MKPLTRCFPFKPKQLLANSIKWSPASDLFNQGRREETSLGSASLSEPDAESSSKSKLNTTLKSKSKKELKAMYSESVLLPKTSFPLYNNTNRELEIQEWPSFAGLYYRQRDAESGGNREGHEKRFVLHDGPPYANGAPHLGHAVNKILKDMICRHKIMRGQRVEYRPGWDCHGLPIELKALNDTDEKTFDKSNAIKIRDRAKTFAKTTIETQKESFKRWGVIGDWNNPYLTLKRDYVEGQLRSFFNLYQKGMVYKSHLPVYWSPSNQTALAEAELEYNPTHVSPSVHVKFKITNFPDTVGLVSADVCALIWTTTPWTLPANQAIAFANKSYSIVKSKSYHEYFLIASEMIEEVEKTLSTKLEVKMTVESDLLKSLKYRHPLKGEKEMPFLEGDHVVMTKGTGLVHSAPNHGRQDYAFASKHRLLPDACLVDEKGCFNEKAGPELVGKYVLEDGSETVMNMLKDNIVRKDVFEHSYPYDWRSKKPVIIRACQQWFINIDKLRDQCVKALDNVTFYPEAFKKTLRTQLEVRPQWCISRQRSWGVPIPVFYAKHDVDQTKPIISKEIVEHVLGLIRMEGPNIWWSQSVDKLLPTNLLKASDSSLKIDECVKGMDILDIWFDSGISWQQALSGPKIADLYLEGYDQIRGWFQSSLITSVALRGIAPYKAVLVHGFTVDEEGRKMSKSEGNVIDPRDLVEGNKDKGISAYGADVLRFFIATYASDHSNVSFSFDHLDNSRAVVKKIRGTLRFFLGVLHEFDFRQLVDHKDMTPTDQYMLHLLCTFDRSMRTFNDSYEFSNSAKACINFVNNVSNFYCTAIKNSEKDSLERRSAQSVCYHLLNVLSQHLAPVTPHLLEEIYKHYPDYSESLPEASIFERGWFHCPSIWHQPDLEEAMRPVVAVKDALNKSLDVKNFHKMDLTVHCSEQLLPYFTKLEPHSELANFMNVSNVKSAALTPEDDSLPEGATAFVPEAYSEPLEIKATVTESTLWMCLRCRRYTSHSKTEPCSKCLQVLASQWK